MSLKKIEDALQLLGFTADEVLGFDLSKEEGYCQVKLKLSPIGIDILDSNKVEVKAEEISAFEKYCKEHPGVVTGSSEKCTDDELTIINRNGLIYAPMPLEKEESKPRWKTPTPRTAMRYIYFHKESEAKKFANDYEKDFEYAASQTLGKDSIQPYKIRKNHSDNELYAQGYMWSLEFRMNGRTFQDLEKYENLKKKESGNKPGHCVRYKES